MSDPKRYTGIVMVPHVIKTRRRTIKLAEQDFKTYIGERLVDDNYVVLDNENNPVTFTPKLQFIQEGDINDEQINNRPLAG